MKKLVAIVLALMLILTASVSIASACLVVDSSGIDWAAKTSDCKIGEMKSEKFTQKELDNACKTVKKHFRTFNDCSLLTIDYNEEESNSIINEYLQSHNTNITSAENAIILTSSFEALNNNAGMGSLGVGTHKGWRWIITRESKNGKWRVVDNGYC